jgi:hypothetical protein
VAVIAPAPSAISVAQVFANIEEIRKRVEPLKGLTIQDLTEEGRS